MGKKRRLKALVSLNESFYSLLFNLSVFWLCAWRGVDSGGGKTEDELMLLTQTAVNKEGKEKKRKMIDKEREK